MDKRPDGWVANLRALRAAGLDTGLNDRAVRIYALLISYADKNGYCFPSQSIMAEKLGVSRQAVGKQVAILVQKGYVKSLLQKGNRTNIYQVTQMPGCIPLQLNKVATPATQSGCTKSPLKKPEKETRGAARAEKIWHRQRDYFQEKKRETETGISKTDEAALAEAIDRAHQGLTLQQRMELDLDLNAEARRLYMHPKQQHEFLIKRYSEFSCNPVT